MDTTTNAPTLAALAGAFETATRPDGTEFVRLNPTGFSLGWTLDACRAAHDIFNALPDDYVYRAVRDVAEMLAEMTGDLADVPGGEPNDEEMWSVGELVPANDHTLLTWLRDAPGAVDCCDRAVEDFGETGEIMETIAGGYHLWLREIGAAVVDSLRAAGAWDDHGGPAGN